MSDTIRSEWEEYERRVVPAAAGPDQRRQTRQAFMAGVLSACNLHRRGTGFETLKVEALEIAEEIIRHAKERP